MSMATTLLRLSLYDQVDSGTGGATRRKLLPNAEMAYYLKALTQYSTGQP